MDNREEDICRFCFEGTLDGPLISPCKCSGGQKYVHLSCLRRWQRMVLVTQPTHPAFYEDDLRHYKCNVCLSEFTCPPPLRHELMQSFTGSEIAALVDEGCVIGSREEFSRELEKDLERIPRFYARLSGINHWIRGSYLITKVEDDQEREVAEIKDVQKLEEILKNRDDKLVLNQQNNRSVIDGIIHDGNLINLTSRVQLDQAVQNLQFPYKIILTTRTPESFGNDHVNAVNLTRPIKFEKVPDQGVVLEAIKAVCTKYPGASKVEITHYIGGPCDSDNIVSCLVPGGYGRGWTIVQTLKEAIELAHSRAVKRSQTQGSIGGGQTVRVVGLQQRPELNNEIGIALRFTEQSGRWDVLLKNGDGKQIKPQNLEVVDGQFGRVYAFWGDARWSRTQLLGEIAKGSWGLCRASILDIISPVEQRRPGLDGRMAFAPVTEMSEKYIKEAQKEMSALQDQAHQIAQINRQNEIPPPQQIEEIQQQQQEKQEEEPLENNHEMQ